MNRRIPPLKHRYLNPPNFSPRSRLLTLTTTMRSQNPRQTLKKRSSFPTLDIVRVGGRYRVGKLLGTGGSGKLETQS